MSLAQTNRQSKYGPAHILGLQTIFSRPIVRCAMRVDAMRLTRSQPEGPGVKESGSVGRIACCRSNLSWRCADRRACNAYAVEAGRYVRTSAWLAERVKWASHADMRVAAKYRFTPVPTMPVMSSRAVGEPFQVSNAIERHTTNTLQLLLP